MERLDDENVENENEGAPSERASSHLSQLLQQSDPHDSFAQITFREFVVYLVTLAFFIYNREIETYANSNFYNSVLNHFSIKFISFVIAIHFLVIIQIHEQDATRSTTACSAALDSWRFSARESVATWRRGSSRVGPRNRVGRTGGPPGRHHWRMLFALHVRQRSAARVCSGRPPLRGSASHGSRNDLPAARADSLPAARSHQ